MDPLQVTGLYGAIVLPEADHCFGPRSGRSLLDSGRRILVRVSDRFLIDSMMHGQRGKRVPLRPANKLRLGFSSHWALIGRLLVSEIHDAFFFRNICKQACGMSNVW